MENLLKNLEDKKVKVLNEEYIKYTDLEEAYLNIDFTTKDINTGFSTIDDSVFPSRKEILLKVVKYKSFWITLALFLVLFSEVIALNAGYELKWNTKLFEILKISFIFFLVNTVANLAKYYFSCVPDNYESGVPTPKIMVGYIANSFITYVVISSFLYMFSINFEALGVENIKDILGTINVVCMILASAQFILYRFFNGIYNFINSTTSNEEDSNSLWKLLKHDTKFYIALGLFLGLLQILSYIYVSISQL
jgi:hypothetical protein